jgi:hypothetical protein
MVGVNKCPLPTTILLTGWFVLYGRQLQNITMLTEASEEMGPF